MNAATGIAIAAVLVAFVCGRFLGRIEGIAMANRLIKMRDENDEFVEAQRRAAPMQ